MVRYDDTDRREVDFPHETGHVHSNDFGMIVGDGGQRRAPLAVGRRTVSTARASSASTAPASHVQEVHVHPRFTPDGSHVLFTSDRTGYGNVYLAAIEEYDTLPQAE